MKERSYYAKKIKHKNLAAFKAEVYLESKFNPNEIDSKSEEKRIREELDKIALERYREYKSQVNKGWEEFENDIYKEFGIENSPKRKLLFDKIRNIAEETNSDEDFLIPDIYNLMEDWVELIKD